MKLVAQQAPQRPPAVTGAPAPDATGRPDAEAKLAAAERALAGFAEEVHRREGAHHAGGET
jgi:hypothetical protein